MMRFRRVFIAAGARPNFMKVAPLWREFRSRGNRFETRLIHTGQHYDPQMSGVFFEDLELSKPDHHLGVGPGTSAEQTGKILVAFERICQESRPDLVIVVGDATSTLACAVSAKKLGIPVAHVEAGLRSGDWTMPEETNRVVTDRLSDLLFVPSPDAAENLIREGAEAARIHFVGNIMIDSLLVALDAAKHRDACKVTGVAPGLYGLLTLHRPSNVDSAEALSGIIGALERAKCPMPIIFPVHPRTRLRLESFALTEMLSRVPAIKLVEPLGYLDFLCLESQARFVVTDSGGVQEETTWLGIPCLTLRANTERPITITEGTNRLATAASLPDLLSGLLTNGAVRRPVLDKWDGKTSARIVEIIEAAR